MIRHEKRAYFQGLVSHPPILRIQGPGSAIRVPPLPSPCCWLPAGASGIVRTGKIGAKSHRFQPAKGNSYPTATSISVSSTLVPAPLFEEGHFSQLMYYWLLGTVIAVTMTKIIIIKKSQAHPTWNGDEDQGGVWGWYSWHMLPVIPSSRLCLQISITSH